MNRAEEQKLEQLAGTFLSVCDKHFKTREDVVNFISDLDDELGVADITTDELMNALFRALGK